MILGAIYRYPPLTGRSTGQGHSHRSPKRTLPIPEYTRRPQDTPKGGKLTQLSDFHKIQLVLLESPAAKVKGTLLASRYQTAACRESGRENCQRVYKSTGLQHLQSAVAGQGQGGTHSAECLSELMPSLNSCHRKALCQACQLRKLRPRAVSCEQPFHSRRLAQGSGIE